MIIYTYHQHQITTTIIFFSIDGKSLLLINNQSVNIFTKAWFCTLVTFVHSNARLISPTSITIKTSKILSNFWNKFEFKMWHEMFGWLCTFCRMFSLCLKYETNLLFDCSWWDVVRILMLIIHIMSWSSSSSWLASQCLRLYCHHPHSF